MRDSQGLSASHDDFGVRFVELGEMAKAGERWETGMSRGMNGNQNLNPTSATTTEEKEKVFVGGVVDEVEELLGLQLLRKEEGREGERDTEEGRGPYWRFLRSMLSALPVVPHETFSYPVACVIAISSRNQHPIETLRNLYTSGTQVPLPSYVQGEYLRYYVLVHDEDRDDINRYVPLLSPVSHLPI